MYDANTEPVDTRRVAIAGTENGVGLAVKWAGHKGAIAVGTHRGPR